MTTGAAEITPFTIAVEESDLADLRERLARTRWPDRETVDDWSQGIPLDYVKDLCSYWADRYDWRRCEAALNGLGQPPGSRRRWRRGQPGHPLPPRPIPPPRRPAARPHPRLARLGRRVLQGDRPPK